MYNPHEPDPEKVGAIVKEQVAIFQSKNCNVAEMGLSALYSLQIMLQFAMDYKQDYPKKMTIQSSTGHDITFEIKPSKQDMAKTIIGG